MILATSSTGYVGVNAASSTPTMNTTAVISTVKRRPIQVGHSPGGKRADHGADKQQARDEFLLERGEPAEVFLDEQQRPGDHAGVVAEEQAAERRDRRAHRDMPAHAPRIHLCACAL